MITKFFKFVVAEWGICLLFAAIILGLNGISTFYANGSILVNIILFLIGFAVSCQFIITSSKLIHRDKTIGNKIKYMLTGKDKVSYDIIVLLVLFSVILIPFKGLIAILTIIPFGKNLIAKIQATPYLLLGLSIMVMLISCMYKTAIYSGLANLVHEKKEVLESFKFGIKNIFRMYPIVIILLVFSIISVVVVRLSNSSIISTTIVGAINYILPGLLVLMVTCSFNDSDQAEVPE